MIPRVASFYDGRQRNDGNPLYVTAAIRRDYPAAVLEYHHIVPDPALQFSTLGKFDAHLWIDWGEDALAGGLGYTPIVAPPRTAYWASDTHLGYEYRCQKAREMAWVFVAQRDAVARMEADGVTAPVEWLPHAVEPDAYNPAAVYTGTDAERVAAAGTVRLKRWDWSFVGHLNTEARIAWLDAVFRAFPSGWFGSRRTGRTFERAADLYTQARVVLNEAIRGDVNMRVFEVLATRSFLLTPAVPGLEDLFTDGVHLVTYRDGDIADCLDKLAYWLPREAEREAIAEAGYREVLASHTFAHRVARMFEVMGLDVPRPASVTEFDRRVPMGALVEARHA